MSSKKFLIITSILLFFILISCEKKSNGTSTGNPMTVSLSVTGSSQISNVVKNFMPKFLFEIIFVEKAVALPPPALVDSNGTSVILNQAWISLKSIEVKTSEIMDGSEGSEVKLVGPYAIDLLSNPAQTLGSFSTELQFIKRFRADFHKMETTELPAGAPVELANQAIYFSFSVGGHSVILQSDEGIEYELSGPNGVTIFEGSPLLLSIITVDLFKKINLSSITGNTVINASNKVSASNPCPLINASATNLYDCFKDGLKSEANFGRDTDDDGELSINEETVK